MDVDKAIEERIEMEIVVDAYDRVERAMGWFYYLEDTLIFPFNATCVSVNKRSPLAIGEQVKVLRLAEIEDWDRCQEMCVEISWNDGELTVPLDQLEPQDADEDTTRATGDWHYWVNNKYSF